MNNPVTEYYSRLKKNICETSFGLIQTIPEDKSKKKVTKPIFKQKHQEKLSICNP